MLLSKKKYMIDYFQIRLPKPEVIRYIKYFWVSKGKILQDNANVNCIFPDGLCHLLYIFKGSVTELESGIKFQKGDMIVIGPREFISRYENNEELGVFGICLYPYVIPMTTSFSSSSLMNNTLEIGDFEFFSKLQQLLKPAKNNDERVCITSGYFQDTMSNFKLKDDDITKVIREMYTSIHKGITKDTIVNDFNQVYHDNELSVAQIISNSPYSARHFHRKFRDYTGFTPKKLQRIIRLKAAVFNTAPENLTRLAIDFGYFDQAHFVNDFKKLSGGISPKKYFEKQNELMWRERIVFVDSFES